MRRFRITPKEKRIVIMFRWLRNDFRGIRINDTDSD
jgi:hypothetical protein